MRAHDPEVEFLVKGARARIALPHTQPHPRGALLPPELQEFVHQRRRHTLTLPGAVYIKALDLRRRLPDACRCGSAHAQLGETGELALAFSEQRMHSRIGDLARLHSRAVAARAM